MMKSKKIINYLFFLVLLMPVSCASMPKSKYQTGGASWYGERYHGRKTASGEIYNMNAMTAAHRSLPFGTQVRVVSKNGKSVTVRINDRGPFAKNRIIDVSKAAAQKLDMIKRGHIPVTLYVEGKD